MGNMNGCSTQNCLVVDLEHFQQRVRVWQGSMMGAATFDDKRMMVVGRAASIAFLISLKRFVDSFDFKDLIDRL